MRKLLFTALVAVAAVGGAYAQFHTIGSTEPTYWCTPGLYTCGIKYGSDILVSPTPAPNQPIQVQLSTIPWGPE